MRLMSFMIRVALAMMCLTMVVLTAGCPPVEDYEHYSGPEVYYFVGTRSASNDTTWNMHLETFGFKESWVLRINGVDYDIDRNGTKDFDIAVSDTLILEVESQNYEFTDTVVVPTMEDFNAITVDSIELGSESRVYLDLSDSAAVIEWKPFFPQTDTEISRAHDMLASWYLQLMINNQRNEYEWPDGTSEPLSLEVTKEDISPINGFSLDIEYVYRWGYMTNEYKDGKAPTTYFGDIPRSFYFTMSKNSSIRPD